MTDVGFRRGLTLVARALRRRCPNCGGKDIFEGWFKMRPECPSCRIHLERREHGYIVGAYMFNIAASELVWLLLMLGITVATWPDPPWDFLLYGGVILMIAAPVVFYPFSKTLFLAADLAVRPKGAE